MFIIIIIICLIAFFGIGFMVGKTASEIQTEVAQKVSKFTAIATLLLMVLLLGCYASGVVSGEKIGTMLSFVVLGLLIVVANQGLVAGGKTNN